jgi:tetratricopeptide (TPR) repeat protein
VIAAAAAAVVAAGGATLLALTHTSAPDPCPAPGARVAAVWAPPRRAALTGKLAALDPALGGERARQAGVALDRGTRAWSAEHVAACRATRVEGRQSEALLDERMRCLDNWLADASRALSKLEGAADVAALDAAIATTARLTQPGACADVTALPPPATAEGRAEATAIADELDALRAAKSAGELGADGTERVAKVIARARALDHAPTLAVAMQRTAEILRDVSAPDAAMLDELTRVAAIAGDDRAAAYAWVALVKVRGVDQEHPEKAEALYASAEAALLRAKDPPHLRFELLIARAGVLRETAAAAEALTVLDRARDVIAAADPARLPTDVIDYESRVAFARALALEELDKREEALVAYKEAIAKRQEMLGPDHPDLGKGYINLGETYRSLDRVDEAITAYQDAARILERLGDSALLAMALDRVAMGFVLKKQPDLALPVMQRAVAMGDKLLAEDNPKRATLHGSLAVVLTDLRQLDAAIAEYDTSIEADEAAGRRTVNLALSLYQRGDVLEELKRYDEAIRDYRAAIALLDELRTGSWYLKSMLTSLGRALVDSGHAKDAIPVLERAGSFTRKSSDAFHSAELRYHLGRALYESGRDRKRGLAEALAGRNDAVAADATDGEIAAFDVWLSKRR